MMNVFYNYLLTCYHYISSLVLRVTHYELVQIDNKNDNSTSHVCI